VLTEPATLDMAGLTDVMHLITTAECPAVPYNRIFIEFDADVQLTDREGNESACTFRSSGNESENENGNWNEHGNGHGNGHRQVNGNGGSRPNVLRCEGETCTLEINGAVNVLVNHENHVALTFDIRQFNVTGFGDPEACSVTMQVTPIHGHQIEGEIPDLDESITGLVSNLSTTDQTFDLTKGHRTFPVLYSDITSSQQPGIDQLLERAQDEGLRVMVLSSEIDTAGGAIEASSLFAMVEGVVSDFDGEGKTFTLTYRGGATIEVDYAGAIVEGAFADGDSVALELSGYDEGQYVAAEVKAGGGTADN